MAAFFGTSGADVASYIAGTLTGFTGGTVAELTDNIGDTFLGSGGADYMYGGSGDDVFDFVGGDVAAGEFIDGNGGFNGIGVYGGSFDFSQATVRGISAVDFYSGFTAATVTFRAEQFFFDSINMSPQSGGTDFAHTLIIKMGASPNIIVGSMVAGTANDTVVILGDNDSEIISGWSLGNDVIRGFGGSDYLNGAGGADTMYGGPGSDSYIFDTAGDIAVELLDEGVDTVTTPVDYTLRPNIERLILTGTATTGVGNELNNTVTGNSEANLLSGLDGNDTLDGSLGADVMRGGLGADAFYVDNVGDIPVETANQGTDGVHSLVSYTLRADFENLFLVASSAAINGVGNTVANSISGNYVNNLIAGRGGNDTLFGGAGVDTFLFDTALNGTTNRDTITDFSAPQDVFRLSSAIFGAIPTGVLAANQFRVSTSAGDADDRIIYDQASGFVYYDANGNGAGGQTLFAILTTKPTLTAADFVVI